MEFMAYITLIVVIGVIFFTLQLPNLNHKKLK